MRLHVAKLRLADRLLLAFLATVVASWAIGGVSAAGAVTLRTAGDSAVFVTENETLALRAKVGTYPTEDRAPPGTAPAAAALPGRAFGSGVGVAAKSVPEIKAGVSGGETAGKAFPRSVKNEAIDENLAATGAQSPTCVWCHMETSTPHIDHAWPRSLGGDATLPNAQVAFPHCNMSRGNGPGPVTPPEGYLGPWPPAWWPNG